MWISYVEKVGKILAGVIATDANGVNMPASDAFKQWCMLSRNLGKKGTIHFVGNGASASMASHFAADITKNCGIRAVVFTDCALITALGNDLGYENSFAVALDRYSNPGDLLVAVSSSGNSPNIVNACREAERLGVDVVTVSGKQPDNSIRKMGVLNFYAPAETYGLAESAHAVLLHHWVDLLETP